MRFIKATYVTVFITFFSFITYAQDDCTVKLLQAEKLYAEGKIEKVPDLIDNCIESGFNKENKINALRLLTLVYLYEDNQEEAEATLLRLLKVDPEYQINRNLDPIEFIRLHSLYNTESVFSLGLVLGGVISTPRLIQTYSGYDFNEAETKYSSSGLGFSIGIKAIYHLNDNIDISFEPKFSQFSYSVNENVSESTVFNGVETLSYIDIPIVGSYYFYEYREASFYADLGFSYSQLVAAKMNEQFTEYTNSEHAEIKGSSIVMNDKRQGYLISGLVGVGVKYKMKRDNIQLNVRYNFGFNNITIPEKRDDYQYYEDEDESLSWKYHYVDNDFSISNFTILVSYNHEFYIHKKK